MVYTPSMLLTTVSTVQDTKCSEDPELESIIDLKIYNSASSEMGSVSSCFDRTGALARSNDWV